MFQTTWLSISAALWFVSCPAAVSLAMNILILSVTRSYVPSDKRTYYRSKQNGGGRCKLNVRLVDAVVKVDVYWDRINISLRIQSHVTLSGIGRSPSAAVWCYLEYWARIYWARWLGASWLTTGVWSQCSECCCSSAGVVPVFCTDDILYERQKYGENTYTHMLTYTHIHVCVHCSCIVED